MSFALALIFFVSSIGIVAFYIMSADKNDKEQAVINQALEQAKNKEKGDTTTKKLEGTKLENYTPIEGGVSELQSTDLIVGNGAEVQPGDTVTVHYTGALVKDGTIFQSSKDAGSPISFSLNEVIQGWTQGVPGMKVGGVRRLVIPANLAYGESSPSANIPANSDLVFDIEVVKIGK